MGHWETLGIHCKPKSQIRWVKEASCRELEKCVETILKENKIFKDQLVLYFKSVAAVMSTQFWKVSVSTVHEFHELSLSSSRTNIITNNRSILTNLNLLFHWLIRSYKKTLLLLKRNVWFLWKSIWNLL